MTSSESTLSQNGARNRQSLVKGRVVDTMHECCAFLTFSNSRRIITSKKGKSVLLSLLFTEAHILHSRVPVHISYRYAPEQRCDLKSFLKNVAMLLNSRLVFKNDLRSQPTNSPSLDGEVSHEYPRHFVTPPAYKLI